MVVVKEKPQCSVLVQKGRCLDGKLPLVKMQSHLKGENQDLEYPSQGTGEEGGP